MFPLQYDFAYIQHQVAGLFCYDETPLDKAASTIVFGRLSRRSFFESGGWAYDNVLGDHTIANSQLTAIRLHETGIGHPVTVFHNAAPASFAAAPRQMPETPRTLVVITNNGDPSLLEAVRCLRERADVHHVGRSGAGERLVTPADIHSADLVISIGKSVQYALLAHTPVYVYDHFGGPGYLNRSNCELTAYYSFTGRCSGRKLEPASLVDEVLTQYPTGCDFAALDNDEFLDRFKLEPYLNRLLTLPPSSNAARRRRMREADGTLKRERMMAEHVRASYIVEQTSTNVVRASERPV